MLDCKRGEDKKIREDKRPKSFNVKTNPSLQELVQTYYILYILANLVTIFLILLNTSRLHRIFLIDLPMTKRY